MYTLVLTFNAFFFRLCSSEAASSQLESKMEAKCNEIEKQTHNAVKVRYLTYYVEHVQSIIVLSLTLLQAMAERDSLQNECVELAKALNDIEQSRLTQ